MKERYERELESLKNKSSKTENELQQLHQDELNKVRQQSQEELANKKRQAEDLLEQMKQVYISK